MDNNQKVESSLDLMVKELFFYFPVYLACNPQVLGLTTVNVIGDVASIVEGGGGEGGAGFSSLNSWITCAEVKPKTKKKLFWKFVHRNSKQYLITHYYITKCI